HDERPPEERRRDAGHLGARAPRDGGGEERDDRPREGTARGDLEQDVGQEVRRGERRPDALRADRRGLHERPREPDEAARDRHERDHRGGTRQRARGGAQPPGTPAHAGRRPHESTRRSTSLPSMTVEKLTFSLARVSPTTPASASQRTARGAANATCEPSAAPSALAPQSPSMSRSPRSPGAAAAAAPRTAPVVGAADVARNGADAAPAALSARPGRRSRRLSRFAVPATSAPLTPTSTRWANAPPVRRVPIAAATSETPLIPRTFIAPVVTRPSASAPRWPRRPLVRVEVSSARSSTSPKVPALAVASATAPRVRASPPVARVAATRPAATAGPSSRLMGSPRWFVRVHRSAPPGGFDAVARRAAVVTAAETPAARSVRSTRATSALPRVGVGLLDVRVARGRRARVGRRRARDGRELDRGREDRRRALLEAELADLARDAGRERERDVDPARLPLDAAHRRQGRREVLVRADRRDDVAGDGGRAGDERGLGDLLRGDRDLDLDVDDVRVRGGSLVALLPRRRRLLGRRSAQEEHDVRREGLLRDDVDEREALEQGLELDRLRAALLGARGRRARQRERERARQPLLGRGVLRHLAQLVTETLGHGLAGALLVLARPRVGEADVPDDGRAGRLELLGDRVVPLAVGPVQVDDGDAAVLQGARDELRPGGLDVPRVVAQRDVGPVELVAQVVALGAQLLDLPRELVADRALERPGTEDDADGEGQEDRDQRDDVVPEVDHCAVVSFGSSCCVLARSGVRDGRGAGTAGATARADGGPARVSLRRRRATRSTTTGRRTGRPRSRRTSGPRPSTTAPRRRRGGPRGTGARAAGWRCGAGTGARRPSRRRACRRRAGA